MRKVLIAVIEAKNNNHGVGDGMQQALINENADMVVKHWYYVVKFTGDVKVGKL